MPHRNDGLGIGVEDLTSPSPNQGGLADPRLTADDDDLHAAILSQQPGPCQLLKLPVTPDQSATRGRGHGFMMP